MSIDIDAYRCRIGSFCHPSQKRFKDVTPARNRDTSIPNWKSLTLIFLKFILLSAVFAQVQCSQTQVRQNVENVKLVTSNNREYSINKSDFISYSEDNNFNARYKYGNRRHGLKLLHWNKGQSLLENKVSEIETIIGGYRPHIFGLSEANFHQRNDISNVQIPEYQFHTSLTLENPTLKTNQLL